MQVYVLCLLPAEYLLKEDLLLVANKKNRVDYPHLLSRHPNPPPSPRMAMAETVADLGEGPAQASPSPPPLLAEYLQKIYMKTTEISTQQPF